jgi:hypothetical protein
MLEREHGSGETRQGATRHDSRYPHARGIAADGKDGGRVFPYRTKREPRASAHE